MAVTPKGIVTPDPSSPYNLITDLNTLASTADAAISNASNMLKGTASQRASALAGSADGVLWQDTDGIKMIWRKDGAAWVPAVTRWIGTTAQMNSFTQAPEGFEWYDVSTGSAFLRSSSQWVGTSQSRLARSGAVISMPAGAWVSIGSGFSVTSSTSGISWVGGNHWNVSNAGRYLLKVQLMFSGNNNLLLVAHSGPTVAFPNNVYASASGAPGAQEPAISAGLEIDLQTGSDVYLSAIIGGSAGGLRAPTTLNNQFISLERI